MRKPKQCIVDPDFVRPHLVELLRVLEEELPPILNGNKFDMGTWHDRRECGTTACAWGWGYELSPALRAAGMDSHGEGGPLDYDLEPGLTQEGYDWLFRDLGGRGRQSLNAVCGRIRKVLTEECGREATDG